ncbi:MAG: Tex family protein [Crocinitomicaceae bacterium]|nr:Tex family protein [Crocinitomicaceae bacterium]MDG1657032.1 Tex family protein [Crocinitomicaceae bacterium]|tara:strand:- start:7911 stop:10019 length:2109 start_codon:yes stop_codon:yes gene_type:complete
MTIQEFVQNNTGLPEKGIQNVMTLLSEKATVPFIARYRKERTGNLDEVEIASIRDSANKFEEIIARKSSIIASITEQGRMDDVLMKRIETCFNPTQLEDIYLPYKQKRLTRGEKARRAGLESLAKMIMSQRGGDPEVMADRFIKGEIYDADMALSGAKDIIAEWMNENGALRDRLRQLFERKAMLSSKVVKGKDEEAVKYKDYFDFSQSLSRCPSHRFLAIYRANREGLLSMKARPEEDFALHQVERFFVKGHGACADLVQDACKDAYKRLLRPSLENEVLSNTKAKADKEAIKVFSKNLRQLLLAAPLGAKRILAIDPGFRTGCKVVCIDESGSLLTNATIFPHPPQKDMSKAKAKLGQLVESYKIDVIAVGDGTAGRETESLVKNTHFSRDIKVFSVREDGASIYSASSIARKEFPDYDVTVRGAVSIGRRLMDPLAELVKIDPKSIGVGQYQHEVNQSELKNELDDVVVSCVNTVGVDVNTASPYLLAYVSGLGSTLAENIVSYRAEHGKIKSRSELKKIKRLGDKAYEQAAGFIRIRGGNNPLDNSSVHPESYKAVEKMALQLKTSVKELIGNAELINKVDGDKLIEIDTYTFNDIISELKKPGHDPREQAKVLEFDYRLKSIDDIKAGMLINGIVTNVTNFGAFVNIGIKENGLIHKSQLADVYVEDPSQFISLDEHVQVQVLEVDVNRKRIGLKRM